MQARPMVLQAVCPAGSRAPEKLQEEVARVSTAREAEASLHKLSFAGVSLGISVPTFRCISGVRRNLVCS